MSEPRARYGWESDFPTFRATQPAHIRERLRDFVDGASGGQERAWRDAIPPLQAEVDEVLLRDHLASAYSAILEYELPMDARRPDVLLLVGAGVMVVELKGKLAPSQADLDQVSAYARAAGGADVRARREGLREALYPPPRARAAGARARLPRHGAALPPRARPAPLRLQDTKSLRVGPWYGDDEDAYGGQSCRRLERCVTEFSAQGLELDAALLAWGTDFRRLDGRWSNAQARGYRRGTAVHDPLRLRLNAYRVLLTRGRDATVVFVPALPALDETYAHLHAAGFRELR